MNITNRPLRCSNVEFSTIHSAYYHYYLIHHRLVGKVAP